MPIQAETILEYENGHVSLRNWAGQTYSYLDPAGARLSRWDSPSGSATT